MATIEELVYGNTHLAEIVFIVCIRKLRLLDKMCAFLPAR